MSISGDSRTVAKVSESLARDKLLVQFNSIEREEEVSVLESPHLYTRYTLCGESVLLSGSGRREIQIGPDDCRPLMCLRVDNIINGAFPFAERTATSLGYNIIIFIESDIITSFCSTPALMHPGLV
jgi:hypothetical protein